MSHCLESMYYVNEDGSARNVPWHGLGTSVEAAPTSADAIRLAGLDWTVKQSLVYTDDGLEIPGYRANIRDTDNAVLGMVGDRYKVVQNSDAFDFTDAMLGEGVKYETAGSLFNGKRIWLLARLPETQILGDDVIPYLCFTNGHDGYHSIKVCCCNVRVVCNNTLNFALSHAPRSWSTRHVGDLASKMEEARRTLHLANAYTEELAVVADQLANTSITEDEVRKILDNTFPVAPEATERTKQNAEDMKQSFMICMLAPDLIKFAGSAYQVAQAAADYADHRAPKRLTAGYQEKNFSNILDGHVVIDKVFEQLMRKVKTGSVAA